MKVSSSTIINLCPYALSLHKCHRERVYKATSIIILDKSSFVFILSEVELHVMLVLRSLNQILPAWCSGL